jgi:hypothetical protein
MKRYTPELEAEMRAFYNSLSEKDRRRYAAIESRKLGHGGHSYIAQVLGCERHTVATGLCELSDPDALSQVRIRAAGGGRKSCLETIPNLETAFVQVLDDHTAGSPTNEAVKWTNLTHQEIASRLKEHEINVSVTVVKQLLDKHDYVQRKTQKRDTVNSVEGRDEQFKNIARLKGEYFESENPMLSIDTKKKR